MCPFLYQEKKRKKETLYTMIKDEKGYQLNFSFLLAKVMKLEKVTF